MDQTLCNCQLRSSKVKIKCDCKKCLSCGENIKKYQLREHMRKTHKA